MSAMPTCLRLTLLALLLTACGASRRTAWRPEPPAPRTEPCEGEVPQPLLLADSAPGRSPVPIKAGSLDVIAGAVAGLMVDQCGEPIALARRVRGTVEFLSLPTDFQPALSDLDVDSTGSYLAYVAFDGRNGAKVVVRAVPDLREARRSRRVTVPPTDAQCGYVVMTEARAWEGFICLTDSTFVRLRGSLDGSRITEDTVPVAVGASPVGVQCQHRFTDFVRCGLRAAGILPLDGESWSPTDREIRFWYQGLGVPHAVLMLRERGEEVAGQVLLIWPTNLMATSSVATDRCGRRWTTPGGSACIARKIPPTDWRAMLDSLDAAGFRTLPSPPVVENPCVGGVRVLPDGRFVDTVCPAIADGPGWAVEQRTVGGYWRYRFPLPIYATTDGGARDARLLNLLHCAISEGARPCTYDVLQHFRAKPDPDA
jgi:hypothetical protein